MHSILSFRDTHAHLHSPGLVHVPWSHPGSQMAAGTTTYIRIYKANWRPTLTQHHAIKEPHINCHSVLGGVHILLYVQELTREALIGGVRPALYADLLTIAPTGKVPSIIILCYTVRCARASIVIRVTVYLKTQSQRFACGSSKPKLAWVATRGHCTCYEKLIHIVITITFWKWAVPISYSHIEGKGTLLSNTAYIGMIQHCNWRYIITLWDQRNLYSLLHCTRDKYRHRSVRHLSLTGYVFAKLNVIGLVMPLLKPMAYELAYTDEL